MRSPPPDDQRVRLVHPAAVGPGVGMFAAVAVMSGFLAFVTLRADDIGMAGSRYVLLMYGLIVIGCRIVFATLPDRVPPLRLMTAALCVSALGLGLAAGVGGADGLFSGAALVALGVAFTTPAFFAAVMAKVSPSERGSASGTASLFIDLGFGGGPMLYGLVVDVGSIPAAFAFGAALAALGAAWTAWLATRAQARPVRPLPQPDAA